MKIFSAHAENTGTAHYRLWMPHDEIKRQKLAEVDSTKRGVEKEPVMVNTEEYIKRMGESDIVATQRIDNRTILSVFEAGREIHQKPWVLDFDDNFSHVNRESTAYKYFKPTSFKEEFDMVEVRMDEVEKWKEFCDKNGGELYTLGDGKTYYVKEKYQHPAAYSELAVKAADMCIVSTPELRNEYRHMNSNIHVWNNCYDFSKAKPMVKTDDKVTVFYAGASSHYADLQMMYNAMLVLLPSNKDLVFKYMGLNTDFMEKLKQQYPDQVIHVKGVEIDKWDEEFNKQTFDIGVAPLEDNIFNRCKSELKWLEYSARCVPTVASDVAPYKRAITHGESGMLVNHFKDWAKSLKKLVREPNLRDDLAAKANEKATSEYDIVKNAPKLLQIYESARKVHATI